VATTHLHNHTAYLIPINNIYIHLHSSSVGAGGGGGSCPRAADAFVGLFQGNLGLSPSSAALDQDLWAARERADAFVGLFQGNVGLFPSSAALDQVLWAAPEQQKRS